MSPDEQLLRAYSALRAEKYEEVIEEVKALDTPTLRKERPKLVAHALAWKAQAKMNMGEWDIARVAVIEAIRLAKVAQDADGLVALRELHGRISASVAALATAKQQEESDRALLERPLSEVLEEEEKASLLLRQAGALLGLGRIEDAKERASLALLHSRSARDTVLALLSLARCEPGEAPRHLSAAFSAAEAVDDHNLIAAVARAAKLANFQLPAPDFG